MNPKSRQESKRNDIRRNSMVVTDFIINPNEPDSEANAKGDSRKSRKGKSSSRKLIGSMNVLNTLTSFETDEKSNTDSKPSSRNSQNLLKKKKGIFNHNYTYS